MNGIKRKLAAAFTVTLICSQAILLQGCYDDSYYNHRDTLTLGSGDAAATSAAVHTIDPWPPYAKNTDIDLEGERARIAIDRYQKNQSIPPRGLSTTEITGQAGPGAQGNTQIKN